MIFGIPTAWITWKEKFFNKNTDIQDERAQPQNDDDRDTQQMLLEGAKLLGDRTSEAEKIAGIACLANIIEGQSKFNKQAAAVLGTIVTETVAKKPHGIIVGTDKVFFQALGVLNSFYESIDDFFPVYGCIIEWGYGRKSDVLWLNIEHITYKGFNFENIDFNKNVASLSVRSCSFNYCRIDSPYRLSAYPDFESVDDEHFDPDGVYKATTDMASRISHCVFDNGSKSDTTFQHADNIWSAAPPQADETCYYNDEFIIDSRIRGELMHYHIKPLSSLTAEERLKVGPQTT